MEKKKWYWILGILFVTVVAAALIWSALPSRETPSPRPGESAAAGSPDGGSGQTDHADMNHGQSSGTDDPNLEGYLEDQDAIMTAMMADMESIGHSGSAAADFLAGMIPHHESAVAMAESYLKHGGDHQVLAPLARDIIAAQTDEISRMQAMLDARKEGGETDEEQAAAYWEAYDKLMDHSMAHPAADSLDAAFAEGMILHHQMAVDMANAVLPHTGDEEVKKLAQTMADTQEQEIGEMQAVLDALQ